MQRILTHVLRIAGSVEHRFLINILPSNFLCDTICCSSSSETWWVVRLLVIAGSSPGSYASEALGPVCSYFYLLRYCSANSSASCTEMNSLIFRNSYLKRLLKDSTIGFCHGHSGGMLAVLRPPPVHGRRVKLEQLLARVDQPCSPATSTDSTGQAEVALLVDYVQALKGPPINVFVELEVDRPDVMLILRSLQFPPAPRLIDRLRKRCMSIFSTYSF